MTKSEIFKAAHEVARRNVRLFKQSYREAFAEGIAAVYAGIAYEARCDARYGVGMRPGFQMDPAEKARTWY